MSRNVVKEIGRFARIVVLPEKGVNMQVLVLHVTTERIDGTGSVSYSESVKHWP